MLELSEASDLLRGLFVWLWIPRESFNVTSSVKTRAHLFAKRPLLLLLYFSRNCNVPKNFAKRSNIKFNANPFLRYMQKIDTQTEKLTGVYFLLLVANASKKEI